MVYRYLVCKTKDVDEANLLKSIAVMKGWKDGGAEYKGVVHLGLEKNHYQSVFMGEKYSNYGDYEFFEVSTKEFLEAVINDKCPASIQVVNYPDKIGGYRVTYTKNKCIKVGCTTITDKEIRDLYAAYTAGE